MSQLGLILLDWRPVAASTALRVATPGPRCPDVVEAAWCETWWFVPSMAWSRRSARRGYLFEMVVARDGKRVEWLVLNGDVKPDTGPSDRVPFTWWHRTGKAVSVDAAKTAAVESLQHALDVTRNVSGWVDITKPARGLV